MAGVCCKYNSGMMRTPVTVERRTLVSDGAGGQTESWATLTTAFAHVVAASGQERYASDRVESSVKWKDAMRWFSGLRLDDRLVFNSLRHNIRFINDLELRNLWLEVEVDGGVAT